MVQKGKENEMKRQRALRGLEANDGISFSTYRWRPIFPDTPYVAGAFLHFITNQFHNCTELQSKLLYVRHLEIIGTIGVSPAADWILPMQKGEQLNLVLGTRFCCSTSLRCKMF